jgi:hypothetical protein
VGVKILLAAALLAIAPAAHAQSLTVPTGESWLFTVKHGQPANAHKVSASAQPAKGQVMVTVRSLLGTAMFVTNNSATPYKFRAELLRGGKAEAARACSLPANGKIFEQWQKPADAVRISNFVATGPEGRC